MGGSNWFGSLQLAYKYIVVFVGLLILTIIGGAIKVLFNRRKLKKAKKTELEAGPKEDTVELNQREKDEGDLFGIRAIEAGFYAGVAQSRPTSRAGSIIEHPNMSSSTLVGNPSSPLMKGHSTNNSVLSLNLGNSNNTVSQQRKQPPPIKLRPSEAELSGRRNHNGAVDMSLQVPPSPGHPRGPASPTFGGSDSDSDGFTSPRSMSPRTADFNPQQYTPAPMIPMPDALSVSYHSGADNNIKSQTASFNNSPGQSPTPPSPGNPPVARLPTLPTSALRKESRSPSPESYRPQVRVHQPNNEPAQSSSAPHLQPRSHAPTHKRDESDASSLYSNGNRLSTYQAYQAYQKDADRSASAASTESYNYNFSSTDESGRTSVALPNDKDGERRPSQSSSLLAPGLMPNGQSSNQDSRLSEFYDAYYRNSQIVSAQPVEMKRIVDRKSTIMEVDSPMPSPLFPKTQQPGAAF
ncbi:uncharacterized protein K460DRAFT_363662 [Cucurbitaria berberidis CBS 394.84]|uniref:Uncharacterized protein n=1 Tax=Cucurbitaria berberidis CBS 394.84 TaxID=1168544 RepID=A0A9P4L9T5_9PLEO|nr:uncharacterized protein K460DRAFT_363662 [Cucurbitaria berberidis CBS 394.84]KAF1847596.1 hypothetical protein K460DRAFT_363662 [Cucurbitaria berberidis CBS 394.84]